MKKMKKPVISIIICTYNDGKYIGECLHRLLRQSYQRFEIIIVNDASTDNTEAIVTSTHDKRIRYFKNDINLNNMGKVRNFAVQQCQGDYIFSIDSDCFPNPDWLEQGLKEFKRTQALAVEGRILYLAEGYTPTFSDVKAFNISGGNYMTGNMAYRKEALHQENFDPEFALLEDRDLALRLKKIGTVVFCPSMTVIHQKKTMGIRAYFNTAKRTGYRVKLEKKYSEDLEVFGRILYPKNLLTILIPPLILAILFRKRFKNWKDFVLIPFIYPALIYERFIIWRAAIGNRIFIL
jgi:glycosyltransferase involved in cell wall biosynthesis